MSVDVSEFSGPRQNQKPGVSVDQEQEFCPGSLKQADSSL